MKKAATCTKFFVALADFSFPRDVPASHGTGVTGERQLQAFTVGTQQCGMTERSGGVSVYTDRQRIRLRSSYCE